MDLSSSEFLEQYNNDNDAVLLDVRTQEEHDNKRIPNSTLIDIYLPDFLSKLLELDKNKSYYVYCRSGVRSVNAIEQMLKLGFTKVYNLKGGIIDWNGPTERKN